MLVMTLFMMLAMMLVMLDILISALKIFPVRITRRGFPLYVITYLVILIRVGLMRQGVVEAGDWHACFWCLCFSQLLEVGKDFSPSGCSVLFSVVSLVLSVIGGISDPTVPVPLVSLIFWAKFKL